MSKPGDVVWADGRAWTRTNWPEKSRWVTESDALPGNRAALQSLKMHDDFRWLVKDGKCVVSGELLELQAAASFHEGQIAAIVADRDDAYAKRRQMAVELDQWQRIAKRAEDGSLVYESWVTGSAYERYSVVKWLRMIGQDQLADTIESGGHLAADHA